MCGTHVEIHEIRERSPAGLADFERALKSHLQMIEYRSNVDVDGAAATGRKTGMATNVGEPAINSCGELPAIGRVVRQDACRRESEKSAQQETLLKRIHQALFPRLS